MNAQPVMVNDLVKRGFLYGLLGTAAMTAVMLLGTATGLSPMPAPVPVALAKWAFGALSQPALVAIAMGAHFLYGGTAGGGFALAFNRRLGVVSGLGWGVLLWLAMGLVFLPLLGWGLFGTGVTARIALATLGLHLIYGGVLGWGLRRGSRHPTVSQPD